MASRRAQVRASILVSKKVYFLGRWHTNEVTEDIMQHLRRNLPLVPSQKAKLKLSELGIFFGKRVVIGRTQDEFIPMEKIVQIVPDAVHTTVLLCLVKTGTKSVFDILVFRCASEKDARESAEVFRRLRALALNNGTASNANGTTKRNGDLAVTTNSSTQLASNGRIIHPQKQQQQQQMLVMAAPSPPPGVGADEEQEEAILVVTPDPGAISPGNDDAYLSSAIHQEYINRNSTSNIIHSGQFRRIDESDAAFKRRMRQQIREALKRCRNRSEMDATLLASVAPDTDITDSYCMAAAADSEYDQVSLSDSITAQQRALNDKVSYIAEEVNRLRSVFETSMHPGVSTNIGLNHHHSSVGGSQRLYRRGRSTSSESERRSRSPGLVPQPPTGHEPLGVYYAGGHRHRGESPSYGDDTSPPLAPGEMFRRRNLVSEANQQHMMASTTSPPSPTASGRSRRLAYVYRQSNEPDVLYVHTARNNGGGCRGSVGDLVVAGGGTSPNRTSVSNSRRGISATGQPIAPIVRVNVPPGAMRSSHSINHVGSGAHFGAAGTSTSKISRHRRVGGSGGMMQRSRSSQWLGGSMAHVVSTNDIDRVTTSPEDDQRARRHRELAERIRQDRSREVVRAQMGIVEREKWELGPEPLYLIRSDNKQHQDRVGGMKLYKARSVPNFLVADGVTQSSSTSKQQQPSQAASYQQHQSSRPRQQHNATQHQHYVASNPQQSQPTYLVALQPASSTSSAPGGAGANVNTRVGVTRNTAPSAPGNTTTVL